MDRIYHPWDMWECYPAGMYETRPADKSLTDDDCRRIYAELLSDLPRFRKALQRVITEWPNSCEHYLTNERMNRVAWLGQASLCIAEGIPQRYRGGYMELTDSRRSTQTTLPSTRLTHGCSSTENCPSISSGQERKQR